MYITYIAAACMALLPSLDAQTFDYCQSSWNPRGRTVLDISTPIKPAKYRSYAAYFCFDTSIELQLWKDEGNNVFSLIWKMPVNPPSVVPGRTVVNYPDGQFFETRSNYRLGIYSRGDVPIPVGAVFYSDGSRTVVPSMGSELTFGYEKSYQFLNLKYPYSFYAQICEQYNCQPLPDPVLPATIPGLTLAPFFQCNGNLLKPNGKVLIERNRILPVGRFSSIVTYFCVEVPVTVQIWEPVTSRTYILKWQRELSPKSGLGNRTVFNVPNSESFDLQGIHRVGLYVTGNRFIPVPTVFNLNSADVVISMKNGTFNFGPVYQFDELEFPYEFRLSFCQVTDCPLPATTTITPSSTSTATTSETTVSSATTPKPTPGPPGFPGAQGPFGDRGVTGPKGPQGSKGPIGDNPVGPIGSKGIKGDQGVIGSQGGIGPQGMQGDIGTQGTPGTIGDTGPKGPEGLPGVPFLAALREACTCQTFQNRHLILGLIIWSTILTLIIVIITCIAAKNVFKDNIYQ